MDSVVSVKRRSERVLMFYGICSLLRETRGGKREFLERIVPFGELYTLE